MVRYKNWTENKWKRGHCLKKNFWKTFTKPGNYRSRPHFLFKWQKKPKKTHLALESKYAKTQGGSRVLLSMCKKCVFFVVKRGTEERWEDFKVFFSQAIYYFSSFRKYPRLGCSHPHARTSLQPCLCLCLGFVLQNTNKRPLLITKKQSLQRLFRAVLVFIPAEGCTQGTCRHCPNREVSCRAGKPEEGSWMELTLADDGRNAREPPLSVKRDLWTKAAGEEKVRRHWLIWATCLAREVARCFSRRGAMAEKLSEITRRLNSWGYAPVSTC